jgi:transposase
MLKAFGNRGAGEGCLVLRRQCPDTGRGRWKFGTAQFADAGVRVYRQVVEVLHYMLCGGLPWRMLPPDLFPPMTTVQHYFYRWRDTGL